MKYAPNADHDPQLRAIIPRAVTAPEKRHKIAVYLDTGDVHEYETDSSAREHVSAIVSGGYRSVSEAGKLTHWPPHRINKVTATGCNTAYADNVRGT